MSLKKSEALRIERLRMATEVAEVGVWEYNLSAGEMTWEESMFNLHGLSREKYPSAIEAWRQSVLPEDRKLAEDLLAPDLHADAPWTTKFRIRTESGEIRTIRSIAKKFIDANGTCSRIIGVHQDVTQSVQDQQRLKELNLDLKQRTLEAEGASRSKSQFLANVSHEIRTPMNAVLGLLSLLRQSVLDARQSDYVEKAEAAGRVLMGLLNDILDVSKAEAGKMVLENVPFDLPQLLDDLMVIMGSMASDKSVRLLFDQGSQLPETVIGDPLRLRQILLNLGGNAVKFTDSGSVVVRVGATVSGKKCIIGFSVEDTGIGISPEMLGKIFQGFEQGEASTTRRFGGTGLGLWICKYLVEAMGGQLDVISAPGRGSTFSFSVEFDMTRPKEKPPIQPQRFLVVDENAQARRVLTSTIRAQGWWAEAVPSLDLATTVVESPGSAFDFVLVDSGEGGEASALIVRELAHVPHGPQWILMTSLGEEPVAGFDFLVKPVTPRRLGDLLENLVSLPAAQPRLSGHRSLVVEDNKLNQFVAQQLLEKEGAVVTLADGGAEALELMAHHEFDSVLMDLQMPDMDGFETTRQLRHRFGNAPFIVAVTANILSRDKTACLLAGMDAHLGKPLEIENLVKVLVTGKPMRRSVFDMTSALARLGNDKRLYFLTVEKFVAESPHLVRRLRASLEKGNAEDAARELHTLKGLARTVGAVGLATCSQAIETKVLEGEKDLASAVDKLELDVGEANRILSQAQELP